MRWLRRLLLDNWALKLFCVLLAFLLWAAFTTEPVSEIGFQVPIEFRNLSPHLDISDDTPTHVRVRVRGRSSVIRRLSPADLAISVNLAGAVPGEQVIRLSPSSTLEMPADAELVRVAPAEIRLRIVRRSPE